MIFQKATTLLCRPFWYLLGWHTRSGCEIKLHPILTDCTLYCNSVFALRLTATFYFFDPFSGTGFLKGRALSERNNIWTKICCIIIDHHVIYYGDIEAVDHERKRLLLSWDFLMRSIFTRETSFSERIITSSGKKTTFRPFSVNRIPMLRAMTQTIWSQAAGDAKVKVEMPDWAGSGTPKPCMDASNLFLNEKKGKML